MDEWTLEDHEQTLNWASKREEKIRNLSEMMVKSWVFADTDVKVLRLQ